MTTPAKFFLKLLAALLATCLLIYAVVWLVIQRKIDSSLQELIESGIYDIADYSRLVLLPNGTMQLYELHLRQAGFNLVIKEITLSEYDFLHATPWYMQVEAVGFQFPDGLPNIAGLGNPALTNTLQGLAIDNTVPAQLSYSYHYDPANEERMVYTATARIDGFFELTGESETRHLSLENLQEMRNAEPETSLQLQQAALANASLPRAELRLTDLGGIEKFIGSLAQSLGTDPDGMRSQLQSQVRNYYLFLPPTLEPIATQMGNELALFFEGSKTLKISMVPANGGKLDQLQNEVMGAVITGDFKRAAEALGFEFRTEQ